MDNSGVIKGRYYNESGGFLEKNELTLGIETS